MGGLQRIWQVPRKILQQDFRLFPVRRVNQPHMHAARLRLHNGFDAALPQKLLQCCGGFLHGKLCAVSGIVLAGGALAGKVLELRVKVLPVQAGYRMEDRCYNIQRKHRIYDWLEPILRPECPHQPSQGGQDAANQCCVAQRIHKSAPIPAKQQQQRG